MYWRQYKGKEECHHNRAVMALHTFRKAVIAQEGWDSNCLIQEGCEQTTNDAQQDADNQGRKVDVVERDFCPNWGEDGFGDWL